MKRDRIVVFGLYKTGTTALFQNIRNSLSRGPRLLHEATRFVPEPSDRETGVLAKVIIGDENVDYGSFMQFEKKVLIIRDPRDWIISGCLFLPQEIERIYLDSAVVEDIVAALRRKEAGPGQVPFSSIVEKVLSYSPVHDSGTLLTWAGRALDTLIEFEAGLGAACRISYEDFVDRRVAGLGRYLGIPISDDVSMDERFDHVARSRTYGNWRSWFTADDVELFASVFNPFLERYGYDTDWRLAEQPTLDPALGSGYVARIVRRKRALCGIQERAR